MRRLHQDSNRRDYAMICVCQEEELLNAQIRKLETVTPPQRTNYCTAAQPAQPAH